MKNILLILLLFHTAPQTRSQNIVITGRTIAAPQQAITYTAVFQAPPPQHSAIRWSVSGGTVVSQNNDPAAGPVTVTIQWADLSATRNGSVSIEETVSRQRGWQDVVYGLAWEAPCGRVMPEKQKLNYGQSPCLISATQYCALNRNSGQPYPHTYQWQISANQLNWQDITGATGADYQPGAITGPDTGDRFYRRITTVTIDGRATDYTSSVALLGLHPLDAGELRDDSPQKNGLITVLANARPQVKAWMAFGSTCLYNQYSYTWERSDNNGPWYEVGHSIEYPAEAPGINRKNVRIRRRVSCGSQQAYSNVLSYTFLFTYPNQENLNYVRSNEVWVRGVQYWEEADILPMGEKRQSTTYLDGLMRPVQTVVKDFATRSGQPADLVQHMEYDNLGRQLKSFLPYTTGENAGFFKTNAATGQPEYYQSRYGEAPAYSQTQTNNSPLNLAVKNLAPGAKWGGGGKFTASDYGLNEAAEEVVIWSVEGQAGAVPQVHHIAQGGELVKLRGTDIKGKLFIEYMNRSGQVVLRKEQAGHSTNTGHAGWICVYWIYDDLGRLRCVIQPRGVEELSKPATGWQLNAAILQEQCFRYEYDERGRLVSKKAPGAGEVVMVYDKRDRLVLSQDANQRDQKDNGGPLATGAEKQWHFVLYDELDRPLTRGLTLSTLNREQLQTVVNGLNTGNQPLNINLDISQGIIAWNPVLPVAGCLNCGSTRYDELNYYDGYEFSGAKTYNTDYYFEQQPSGNNQVEPLLPTQRVYGMATCRRWRVLAPTAQWLKSTAFFTEEGRALQGQTENIKGGTDISTLQYDFSGRLLATSTRYNNPGAAGYERFFIHRKTSFDHLGRPTEIYQAMGFGNWKKLAEYSYTDLGMPESKKLGSFTRAGQQSATELESLHYSYNLHGWITGINKDYALSGAINRRQHYFGMYLEYENKQNLFPTAQLDGKVSGWQWRSQGDGVQRRYEYEYDLAERLTAGRFKQREGAGPWSDGELNFSSFMSYDGNGNLQMLQHWTTLPGAGSQLLDDLRYEYKTLSNRLKKVTDLTGAALHNGRQGDFKDGTNGSGDDDYEFDASGSMTIDRNKKITRIQYNALGQPWKIWVDGRGEIEYVYDADGEKLEKIVRETGRPEKRTLYMGAMVYENNELRYLLHPEGRVRVISPQGQLNEANFDGGGEVLPGGRQGVYDYYITDHLGNTRMILTEQVKKSGDVCTMEDGRAAVEEAQFGNAAPGNEVQATRTNKPAGWQANSSARVSSLQAQGGQGATGPNALLKVMAGDKIHARADYYYEASGTYSGGSGVNTLLNGLMPLLGAGRAGELAKQNAAAIGANISAAGGPLQGLLGQQQGGSSSMPYACLNYIFLDEQLKFVSEGSGYVRVQQSGDGAAPLVVTNIEVPRNGYIYIYLSNESSSPVFFDNFAITHERGRMLEDNHYYPYGLKIAAISSHAEGTLKNEFLYNGKELASGEFEDGSGLDWYEYGLREYDAQIGRFFRVDPLTDEFPWWTPYQYAGCEPVANTDLDGAEPDNATAAGKSAAEAAIAQTLEVQNYKLLENVIVHNTKSRGYYSSLRIATAINNFLGYVPEKELGFLQVALKNQLDMVVHYKGLRDSYFDQTLDLPAGSNDFRTASDLYVQYDAEYEKYRKNAGDVIIALYKTMSVNRQNYDYNRAVDLKMDILTSIPDKALEAAAVLEGGKLVTQEIRGILGAIVDKMINMRGGYGLFGASGLRVGQYRLDLLYKNPKAGNDALTFFSLKQLKQNGALWRWEYGAIHGTSRMGVHSTIRFYWNGVKYGSTAQRKWYPSTLKAPFFKPIK